MHMLPHDRQNWTGKVEITLQSYSPVSHWPPKRWMSFSNDAKLLIWETVATALVMPMGHRILAGQ